MNKIVIMGGSFNPPTVAHQRLLLAAVDAIGADIGVFVPSSHQYVKNKMKKYGHPVDVFDEDVRLQMLLEMAKEDPRLTVDDYEYHLKEKNYTYDTMVYLKEKYPEAELYFLAGGDKIDIFPRWYRIKDFLEQFSIIVTNRKDYDIEAALGENPFLSLYREKFIVIDYPTGIGHISSSAVRENWKNGNDTEVREMVHPMVYEIMSTQIFDVIECFREEYYFLSNFYSASITYRGLTYKNAEAAFQAQKCVSEEERKAFTEYEPLKAKNIGRSVQLREDWENVKVSIMEEIVYAKFSQNNDLKEMLLATGNAKLKEGNAWGDVFWGVNAKTGSGQNNLGKILMKVRKMLRSENLS